MTAIALSPTRKITISLPGDLVTFTDSQAQRSQTSRSQFISNLLSRFKAQEEERLAIEGYKFYAEEAAEFAIVTSTATAEAFTNVS